MPSLDSSGVTGKHGGPTKRGDALLREALFMSANQARRYDPTLAAKYHRLMVVAGKPHNAAMFHIATRLLTRVAACWKAQTPYQLKDVDGRPIDPQRGQGDHRRAIHRPRASPTNPHNNDRRRDGPAK